MIYHKDWLIRQIEQMVDAVTHLLMNTATTATITETTELESREYIDKMLQAGEICAAEDWLYERLDALEDSVLRLAVYFYSSLNQYSDSYLEEHNFSREEIASGLKDICYQYGYPLY